jgi:hypothetical protein
MPEVTGTIGNDHVELNNAATEATLKLILAGIKGSSKEAAAAIDKLAKNAGLDPDTIKKVNDELTDNSTALYKLGQLYGSVSIPLLALEDQFKKYSPLVKTLTDGSGNVSSAFNQLGAMVPGAIGVLLKGVGALAGVQQDYLKSYQTMTQAGVGFGGSLTDMRKAASDSFLTLDQFTKLVSENGEAFAKMGSTAGEGAKSFVKLSNTLINSPVGDNLLALGMTTEEVNQKLVNYINQTGGRNRKEMENTEAITQAMGAYYTELDKLTQFTGASTKKMEEEQKKAAANAAFQRKLATMSEEEKAKTKAAYDAAAASGIEGATDLVMSTALGLPPMTEAARQLQGIAPKVANEFNAMTKTAMTHGTTMKDVERHFIKAGEASQEFSKDMGGTADAIIMGGGKMGGFFNSVLGFSNTLDKKGGDIGKAFEQTAIEQKARAVSQANDAAQAQKAMQELGQEILASLLPVFKLLSPIIPPLAAAFLTLAGVLTAFKLTLMAVEAFERIKLARESGAGVLGTARALLGGKGGVGGGSNVAGGLASKATGTAGSVANSAGGLASKATGTAGSVANSAGGGVSKVLGGLAEGLKKLGDPKALLGAVTLAMLGGTVLIAAKGFKEFGDVEWESVGKGIVGITGLAAVAMLLSSASVPMMIGAVAVGLLGGALWLAGKGFRSFQELDWETIAKGAVGITGLAAVAMLLSSAAVPMIIGAVAVGLLGGALWLAGKGFRSFQELDWETMAKGAVGIGVLGLEAAGLGLLSPAIIAGGAALILAGAGIAAVGLAMKLLPDNTVDSLTSLGQGLKALWDNTPVSKLFLMAPAIGALGLAMVPLTISTALYKASGGLSQLTADLVNITKTIDSSKIDGLSSSIKGLASSMSSLSGGGISGILSGLGEKFGKLMGAEGPLEKLQKLAKLGPGLMASGQGMQLLNQNLSNMLNLKVNNIDQMTESLGKIKVNSTENTRFKNLQEKTISMSLPPMTKDAQKLAAETTSNTNQKDTNPVDVLLTIAEEMRMLNSRTQDMIKHARDAVDYSKQNVDATKKLNGNLFA